MRGNLLAALAPFLFVTALAGCLSDDPADPMDHDAAVAAAMAAIGTPTHMLHDHHDVREHMGIHNLDVLAWSPLDVSLGDNGFANFVLWDEPEAEGGRTLAFVAIDGDTEGGFTIADITDPTDILVVGSYRVPGNGIQEVRVTPDGRFAVMNVQEFPHQLPPGEVVGAGLGGCSVCIHVVNIEDKTAPRLVSIMPVELLGTHNFHFEEYSDGLYLFAVGQPLGLQGAGGVNLPTEPGNHVWVYRFVEAAGGTAVLVPVSSFFHDLSEDDGRSFPHDVLVQDHPDGRKIAYVSHWEGGHVTFDVTDPLLPTPLGVLADAAPSDALSVHWMMQEPTARTGGAFDGRTLAWSAPEIGQLATGSGIIRALDVTDPADMVQVGTWDLPGDVTIDEGRFIFSPHTAIPDMDRGLLAVAHYHAGLWVLDISDPTQPRHTAFFEPHGDPADPYDGPVWWKKPNFDPDGYAPNVYQARWHDGLLVVTDRGTGLYVLDYTGPVGGPL